MALTSTFLIAEVVAGIAFNSLALLSDAAHMFTDAAALAIALAAIRVGQKKATEEFTFGYRRFEILAAAFSAILLFGVAIYVLVEGVKRIVNPEPVGSVGMFIVAVLGLVINLISMRLLSSHKDKSLNVKGAYLEVWADMLGSVGVIAGAIVIKFTGWRFVDPIVAIGIGLWVLPRTWILLKDTQPHPAGRRPSGHGPGRRAQGHFRDRRRGQRPRTAPVDHGRRPGGLHRPCRAGRRRGGRGRPQGDRRAVGDRLRSAPRHDPDRGRGVRGGRPARLAAG
ncbi:cation diffusion facilitator family transporter [Caulobacter segnis]